MYIHVQVRIKAQNALSSCVDSYLYAGRKILPDILPFLKSDNGVSHEQFKVIIPSEVRFLLGVWTVLYGFRCVFHVGSKFLFLLTTALHALLPTSAMQYTLRSVYDQTHSGYIAMVFMDLTHHLYPSLHHLLKGVNSCHCPLGSTANTMQRCQTLVSIC